MHCSVSAKHGYLYVACVRKGIQCNQCQITDADHKPQWKPLMGAIKKRETSFTLQSGVHVMHDVNGKPISSTVLTFTK